MNELETAPTYSFEGLKKSDLVPLDNLKSIFKEINDYLYAKMKYSNTSTRNRAKQVINLIICKLIDELTKEDEEALDFCIKSDENETQLSLRIKNLFNSYMKDKFVGAFNLIPKINLEGQYIYYIVQKIQSISLLDSSNDILKDVFEVFVSKALKEDGGQFLTPSNIVSFMVNFLNPQLNSRIIDPACGHGGFLLEAKDYLFRKIELLNFKGDFPQIHKKKVVSNLYGIDKDSFLAYLCKLYLGILSIGQPQIFCEDSLDILSYHKRVQENIKDGIFDYILTNPPFGSNISIDDQELLNHYSLGHIWEKQKDKIRNNSKQYKITNNLANQQAPQVLFIERCLQLLREGGKMGIILPDGIFGNSSDKYIWDFLRSKGKILAIISLDQNSFQPYTSNKTSILFFQKLVPPPRDYEIKFAIVENVGHDKTGKTIYKLHKDGSKERDKNGNSVPNDDLITLNEKLESSKRFDYRKDQNVFHLRLSQIHNNIFVPSFYTNIEKPLKRLEKNPKFELVSIQELMQKNIIYTNANGNIPRGDEIGSHVYGLGKIPFIRTTEICNWEINLNSNKKTSEEIYNLYKEKQNVEVGDLFIVKDGGSNLIGETAFITEIDTKIIFQSHIYQIKVLRNQEAIDSYLILYCLNLDLVQRQIEAITFSQGTLSSIGTRLKNVKLPIPISITKRKEISSVIKDIIEKKKEIKRTIMTLSEEIQF